MPEKHLFEYAVIRIVPRVDREEFINVGIILYCKKPPFLQCLYHLDKDRISVLCRDLDCGEVEEYLRSFKRICDGTHDAGPIGQLDMASRFRWLTATRSTVVQTSRIHPGFTINPEETLKKLYEQQVL